MATYASVYFCRCNTFANFIFCDYNHKFTHTNIYIYLRQHLPASEVWAFRSKLSQSCLPRSSVLRSSTTTHCLFYCSLYMCVCVCLRKGFIISALSQNPLSACVFSAFFSFTQISSIKHSLLFITLLSRPIAAAYAFRDIPTPIRVCISFGDLHVHLCIVFVCAWSPRDI